MQIAERAAAVRCNSPLSLVKRRKLQISGNEDVLGLAQLDRTNSSLLIPTLAASVEQANSIKEEEDNNNKPVVST